MSGVAQASLRANFVWTVAGNVIYAAGQWAILSLLAKMGGSAMLGAYALAVAVSAPVVMLSHLNLRAVLATDSNRIHPFGDYLAVRALSSGLALLVVACVAEVIADSWELGLAIFAVGLGQSAETVSDIFYGAMQRRERMDLVAQSMIVRTLLSLLALAVVLWATESLLWAVVALAAGRVVVLMVFDARAGSAGEDLSRLGWRSAWRVLRTALPLGFVLMLVSLNTNLPRYAIEHFQGVPELGIFAAVVSFITVGSTIVNAFGQSSTPRMARHFAAKEVRQFLRLVYQMTGVAFGLGVAGMLMSWLLGSFVLRLLYRPEYAEYDGLLVAVMAAGTLSYMAVALGYGVTSARVFDAQMPLFGVAAVCCGVASWLLVPPFGLNGAVLALALGALVQISGQVVILRLAIRKQREAAV